MPESDWKETDKRFVAFFDIMGFRDLVQRNTHDVIVEKLRKIKTTLTGLAETSGGSFTEKYEIKPYQTKSITFSDSIIVFSKSDGFSDAMKILADSYIILKHSIENGIAIKGALSYGEITVDFNDSLFFGQPIIDSYLLHDELQLYTAIIDHNFESKLATFDDQSLIKKIITDYKTNLKTGKVMHKLLSPNGKKLISEHIDRVLKLYNSVSGRPRIYVDNTLDFLNSLIKD